jgi:hypothetical protein
MHLATRPVNGQPTVKAVARPTFRASGRGRIAIALLLLLLVTMAVSCPRGVWSSEAGTAIVPQVPVLLWDGQTAPGYRIKISNYGVPFQFISICEFAFVSPQAHLGYDLQMDSGRSRMAREKILMDVITVGSPIVYSYYHTNRNSLIVTNDLSIFIDARALILQISFCAAMVVILCMVGTLIRRAVVLRRSRAAISRGACGGCGYPIHDLPHAICPECGASTTSDS